MTYGTFKSRLSRRLTHHQLSSVAVDVTFNSNWCVAVREFIQDFMRACEVLYVHKATLTLALNDQVVDLSTAVTTYDIYDPWVIYISSQEKEQVSLSEINEDTNQVSVAAGTPTKWAKLDFYRIIFDKPCSAGLTGTYVSGLSDHTAFVDNNTVLLVPETDVPALLDYCAAQFASEVAGDELGLAIANRYQRRADTGMMRVLSRNRARRFLSAHRGEG